jgi:hypothetical protein
MTHPAARRSSDKITEMSKEKWKLKWSKTQHEISEKDQRCVKVKPQQKYLSDALVPEYLLEGINQELSHHKVCNEGSL